VSAAINAHVKFNGALLKKGSLPAADGSGSRVTLAPDDSLLTLAPGGSSIMALDVENPSEEADPVTATLIQLDDSDGHIEVPATSHVSHRDAGSDQNAVVHIENSFSVEKVICKELCNQRLSSHITIAVKLKDGGVSERQVREIELDCRRDGDPQKCKGDASTAKRDAGGPNTDASTKRDAAAAQCSATCSTPCSSPMIRLRVTTDDEGEVFVNGMSVGTITFWRAPLDVDVSRLVSKGGKNVLAIRGANASNQDGNDRGIIAELVVSPDASPAPLLVTDSAWRVATTEQADWTSVAYDDSSWSQATEIANQGDMPWGPVLTITSSKWIWSATVPAAASDKPAVETTYARRTFNLSLDGKALDDKPACP
jgi:hypothetical protein